VARLRQFSSELHKCANVKEHEWSGEKDGIDQVQDASDARKYSSAIFHAATSFQKALAQIANHCGKA
jgi:hypothetical protein